VSIGRENGAFGTEVWRRREYCLADPSQAVAARMVSGDTIIEPSRIVAGTCTSQAHSRDFENSRQTSVPKAPFSGSSAQMVLLACLILEVRVQYHSTYKTSNMLSLESSY